MPHLTVADLVSRRVPLAASEAAALTLAVARVMDSQRAAGQRVRLPDDEWILLNSRGEVSLVEVHRAQEVDETAALSALLRRLLQLDHRSAAPSSPIPGGLLIVLARNLGYIHLPATGPAAFRAALERFAACDAAALASVFWRAASGRPELLTARQALAPPARRSPVERRQRGPSRSDLRRALRELDREIYELRGARSNAVASGRPAFAGIRFARPPRPFVAPAVVIMAVALLAAAALAVARGASPGAGPPPGAIALIAVPEWNGADQMRHSASAPQIVRTNRILADEGGTAPVAHSPRIRPQRSAASRLPAGAGRTGPAPAADPARGKSARKPRAGMPGGTRGIPFAMP
jgi:hypothetical protein